MAQHHKLRVGITMGDVNGIGPELIIKAFMDQRMKEHFIPILYGSSRVINIYRKVMNVNKFHYVVIQNPSQAQNKKLNIIESVPGLERVDIGKPSEIGGKAAHLSLKRALEDAQHGAIDTLVTLPVDKKAMQEHAPDFKGHTELLAETFNVKTNLMLMVAEELRVGTVTNHLPIQDVSRNLNADRIIAKARILNDTLIKDFSIPRPMIAILGLNPHAGDRGLIGNEEIEIISKAVTELKKSGIRAFGPYPADGFFGAMSYKKFDATLAMYHDQGLIPFKLIAGYRGVNYTAGMPFIRTSPDHGVAYDIAGKGTADPVSLRQALYVALDVHKARKMHAEISANPLKVSQESDKHSN
ncbi:MAG: 4-hydroxythreonine-4-phosphate dehydrogenase PdxA [Bacteroidota bacterium]